MGKLLDRVIKEVPIKSFNNHTSYRTIAVTPDLYDYLKSQGKYGETMSEIIKRLIAFKVEKPLTDKGK